MKILLGILLGVLIAKLYRFLDEYLKKNNLKIDWKNIVIIIVVGYLVYSFIGIIVSPSYKKPNGNECKGFNYGIQICTGDINAE